MEMIATDGGHFMRHFKSAIVGIAFCYLGSLQALASSHPAYSCVFTEPFIGIDSFAGRATYKSPEKQWPDLAVTLQTKNGVAVLDGRLLDGKSFHLRIVKGKGSDGMSDMVRPYAGELSGTVVGMTLSGACLKFPDGSVPRLVKGVAENDVLNVREAPMAKGKIVGTVDPRGEVWVLPVASSNGWLRVAIAVYPKDEQGDVNVIEGWVNGKFVGDVGTR
jgi:uncharacterized membrane protein